MLTKLLAAGALATVLCTPTLAADTLKRVGDRPAACDSYREYAGFIDRIAARAASVNGGNRIVVKSSSFGNDQGYVVTFDTYHPEEPAPLHARSVEQILRGHNCH